MYSNNDEILQAAYDYAELGLSVFPCYGIENGKCTCNREDCSSLGKHPKTANGCKAATKDKATIYSLFNKQTANVGVATGSISKIWVIDVDSEAALSELQKLGTLPPTPTVETGRGRHFYFKVPEGVTISNSTGRIAKDIDIRGDGGYVLAPPSQHASGKPYKWLVPPSKVAFADAPEWLLEKATTKRGPTITLQATGTDERIKRYLDRCPLAVSGDGGHNTLFCTVCKVLETFPELVERSENDLLYLLDNYNQRCDPPWSDSELRHKIRQARERVDVGNPIQDSNNEPGNLGSEGFQGSNGSESFHRCGESGQIPTEPEKTPEPTEPSKPKNPEFPHSNEEKNESKSGLKWVIKEDAYHGLVGDILRAIEPETEADPAAILLSLLTAFGNAIGSVPHYPVGAGSHHTNLFACLVGDTASGKGQAWSIASRIMRAVSPDWERSCIARGLSSGEGLVERISDPEEEAGTLTIPPLQRLLCVEEEFARPITAMRREGCTLSPILRSAWDNVPLEVMTRGKSKLRASNAFVSILGQTTQEELTKLLGGSVELANGFSNRFLWCVVRSTKLLPHGGDVSVLDKFTDRLKKAYEKAKITQKMERSKEANDLWETVYPELKRSRKGPYGRAVSRACPQVVRLSIIYALFDESETITVDHLRAALAVWQYCDLSAWTIFRSDLEGKISDYVRENPGCSKTDIRKEKAKNESAKELDTVLQTLEARGDIRSEKRDRTTFFFPGDGFLGSEGSDGFKGSEDSDENAQTPTEPREPEKPPEPKKPGFGELLDWSNDHGNSWTKKTDGVIWVTFEGDIPPDIQAAIRENQKNLEPLVTYYEVGDIADEVENELKAYNFSEDELRFIDELVDSLPERGWDFD